MTHTTDQGGSKLQIRNFVISYRYVGILGAGYGMAVYKSDKYVSVKDVTKKIEATLPSIRVFRFTLAKTRVQVIHVLELNEQDYADFLR